MRTFPGLVPVPYLGQVFSKPIRLQGVAGSSCPLIIQWLSYGASAAVPNIQINIDMSSQLVARQLGVLRSVYIDNMGSDVPIYITFPDTGYTIVAQPNSAGWFPTYTNGMQCQIIGAGFFTGDIPTTFVLFTNVAIPAQTDIEIATAVSLWRASSTITRGNTILNTNLGVPALGDQFISGVLLAGSALQTQTIFNFGGGFIYLTNFSVVMNSISGAAGQNGIFNLFFESTGSAGIFWTSQVLFASGQSILIGELINTNGNFKLDGSQLWRIRTVFISGVNNGTVTFNFSFTTNPQ